MFIVEIALPSIGYRKTSIDLTELAFASGVDEVRTVKRLNGQEALTMAFSQAQPGVQFHAAVRVLFPHLETLAFTP